MPNNSTRGLLLGTALGLIVIPFRPGAAMAELELQEIVWQTSRWEKGKLGKPQDIAALSAAPDKPLKGRLLAKLKLLNRGPVRVEGVLLRYSVTPKIAPQSRKDQSAWALPIVVEERRVPKVGPNQVVDVPIDPTSYVELNLKRLAREGYWASELKIEIMLVPRRGDDDKIQIVSSTLPVAAP